MDGKVINITNHTLLMYMLGHFFIITHRYEVLNALHTVMRYQTDLAYRRHLTLLICGDGLFLLDLESVALLLQVQLKQDTVCYP